MTDDDPRDDDEPRCEVCGRGPLTRSGELGFVIVEDPPQLMCAECAESV